MDTASKVLLMVSGGPDSATLAKMVEAETRGTDTKIHAIYIRSGHETDDSEIAAADAILREVGGKLEIIDLTDTLRSLGSERLLIHSEASILPFGNAIALSIATSYAMKIGAARVYVALHRDDVEESAEYSRSFMDGLQNLARFGRRTAPEIVTPFIDIPKAEVFRRGLALGVPYELTWSCIRNGTQHCGQCGACRARRRAFNEAGVSDPTSYRKEPVALASTGIESEPASVK